MSLKNSVLVSLFFLNLCVATSSIAAGKVGCDAPKYDFGTVIGQEKVTHEFILWNRGDSPVIISNIKNCCGVESKVVPETIPPGSNAVCTAVFTTKNRYGSQDKQILLITNDKKHPYFDLRLTGTLLKPVEFSPRLIRLGTLLPDADYSQTITATNLLEKAVELESVESTIKGIGADIVASNDRNWKIELKSIPPLMPGKLNGQIQLHFSSGTVKVPIIGSVKPIIQVVPAQIQFSARSAKGAERLIMLRSGDGRKFDILLAELQKMEGTVAITRLAPGRWQCKVCIDPNTIKSGSCLRIKTSVNPGTSIDVPVLTASK